MAGEFHLFNLHGALSWKQLTLYAGLKNLFDTNYAYAEGYPEAGEKLFYQARLSIELATPSSAPTHECENNRNNKSTAEGTMDQSIHHWFDVGIGGNCMGKFLHNLRVPFSGHILTAIGLIILISASYRWKDKGFVLARRDNLRIAENHVAQRSDFWADDCHRQRSTFTRSIGRIVR